MKLTQITPNQSINKAYRKEKVGRLEIELFKKNLKEFLVSINEKESEEHVKNNVTNFLYQTYYQGKNQINTKGRIDLAIYEEKKPVVIFEAKRPNSTDMLSSKNLNAKAMHELMLYYLRERIEEGNTDIKFLVATNVYEWFVFDASVFDKLFYQNTSLTKEYTDWKSGRKPDSTTDFFYTTIAAKFLKELKEEITFTWFNLRDVEKVALNEDPKDDAKLIPLFKLLSPAHLLKQPFANDSNSLDTKFYTELLHIIGLEEKKDGGKKLIQRKEKPDEGSLLENAINNLIAEDHIQNLPRSGADFGETKDERLFNVALELCITWVNRILFLKLLEGQLRNYHGGDTRYRFLDYKTIPTFDELNKLFFQVLAREHKDRTGATLDKFKLVPYLNSSLFEVSPLERDTLRINNLDDGLKLKLLNSTVLKNNSKKKEGDLPTLQYIFEFLDSYDFTSEGKEEIQEENKGLINASVLGLIFEKINGYKDGSFFTPGFITMYMCRETIRRAVVQKFKEAKGWELDSFADLHNHITSKYIKEANEIINSLKICDPAVGSGHFLVSALNEIIAIKSELGVLADQSGKVLRGYAVEVINDELIVSIDHNEFFEYRPGNKDSQRVQEALFHEKQTIIENCLFGVDINPNSVKICRLRLWIELLKNAYYTEESKYIELETLPNIDINIKQGNSLISRFPLDADLSKALKSIKYSIDDYRAFVNNYKNATDKDEKRGFENLINQIRGDFRTEIGKNDPKVQKKNKLGGELFNLLNQAQVFEPSEKEKKQRGLKKKKLEEEINKLDAEIEEIKSSAIYRDAFEWRFEFPEVLDSAGNFKGFDLVIGNPPYISNKDMHKKRMQAEISFFDDHYLSSKSGNYDIYVPFIEKGIMLCNAEREITFIVPNKFVIAKYSQELLNLIYREYSFKSFTDLSDFNVFEEASVYPIIISIIKGGISTNICKKQEVALDKNTLSIKKIIDWDYINHTSASSSNDIEDLIIRKIEQIKNINYSLTYSPGINGFQFTNYGKCVTEGKTSKLSRRLVVTGGIDRYVILDTKTRYRGIDYKEPYINYDEEIISPAKWTLFSSHKIIVAGMTKKIEAALDESGTIAPAVSVYSVLGPIEILKYTLAILNSKLIDWYFKLRFKDKHLAGGYISINAKLLEKIPIADNGSKHNLILLCDKVVSAKKADSNSNTSKLEKEIDHVVYKIYGLTEDEIKIVEEA